MSFIKIMNKSFVLLSVCATALIMGCDDDNNSSSVTAIPPTPPAPVVYDYQVQVTNLTHGQPLSPVAAVLHNDGYLWQVGMEATVALETMAESGDNSALLTQDYVLASSSGAGVIMPGMEETVTLSITDIMPMKLSVATMLVNTNDAFTGINGVDVSNLMVGESISLQTSSYDAGTENNSEMASTIPGPAGNGEGFNAARDDINKVVIHAGIVSQDDGLMQSVLTQAHRFDNPTMYVTVTRVK